MRQIDADLVLHVIRLECALLDRLQATTGPLDVPTVVQIADGLGADLRATQWALQSLTDDGLIYRVGESWYLTDLG